MFKSKYKVGTAVTSRRDKNRNSFLRVELFLFTNIIKNWAANNMTIQVQAVNAILVLPIKFETLKKFRSLLKSLSLVTSIIFDIFSSFIKFLSTSRNLLNRSTLDLFHPTSEYVSSNFLSALRSWILCRNELVL